MYYNDIARIIFLTCDELSNTTVEETAISIAEIQETGSPLRLLWDVSKAKRIKLNKAEVMRIPALYDSLVVDMTQIRIALLTNNQDLKIFAAMQTIYSRNGIDFELFNDTDSALTWLQSW